MIENLKRIREKHGITQEGMAKFLGYKYKSGYNNIETGKRKLDLETAKKIADIFNIKIDDLFFKK
ncbi:helix-turn-helix transcriptional regulator [Clostridium sp.]|uniref:helix-turn-helix transcriptional regulator n=1 Tax=Clostridium sp. TaxID=1506 RepID=UPI003464C47B